MRLPPARLAGLKSIHVLQDCCPRQEEEEEGRPSAPCMPGEAAAALSTAKHERVWPPAHPH